MMRWILEWLIVVWNEFASQESCMELGAKATVLLEMFGGIKIEVEVPQEVNDELTALPLDYELLKGWKQKWNNSRLWNLEGTWPRVRQERSLGRKALRYSHLDRFWPKDPGREFMLHLIPWFVAMSLALASLWDLWLITSDVSTAFMYAEVEEDACDLVLLPSNISYKGERVVCLLYKAVNGLRRAPLLWFYQLQRTVFTRRWRHFWKYLV